tara:strand:+ start:157 stop:369 length:213 start_codon:yes stop_codon:yes gene_type:complete
MGWCTTGAVVVDVDVEVALLLLPLLLLLLDDLASVFTSLSMMDMMTWRFVLAPIALFKVWFARLALRFIC